MSRFKVENAEVRTGVVPRRFFDKLGRLKKQKLLSEGQTPDSVADRLRRYLSDKSQQQSAGS